MVVYCRNAERVWRTGFGPRSFFNVKALNKLLYQTDHGTTFSQSNGTTNTYTLQGHERTQG
jgi:hypothetical protein